MTNSIDARAVLVYLNELGFINITAQQLKEFLTDLKKLMKFEEAKKRAALAREKRDSRPLDTFQNDILTVLHHYDQQGDRKRKPLQSSTPESSQTRGFSSVSRTDGDFFDYRDFNAQYDNRSKQETERPHKSDAKHNYYGQETDNYRAQVKEVKLFPQKVSREVGPDSSSSTSIQYSICSKIKRRKKERPTTAKKTQEDVVKKNAFKTDRAVGLDKENKPVKKSKEDKRCGPNKATKKRSQKCQCNIDDPSFVCPHGFPWPKEEEKEPPSGCYCCDRKTQVGDSQVTKSSESTEVVPGPPPSVRPSVNKYPAKSSVIKCKNEYANRRSKTDPIALYNYYKNIWAKSKIPGENCNEEKALRWHIREKFACGPPVEARSFAIAKMGARRCRTCR